MKLEISSAHLAQLLAEAAASPDREVCGLLLGEGLRVSALLPAANVSPSPHDSFEIDPAVLIAAHRAAREGAHAIIGCYHSHPNGRAEPSARDLESAEEGAVWIILANGDVGCWLMSNGKPRPLALMLTDED
jgi:desampylase